MLKLRENNQLQIKHRRANVPHVVCSFLPFVCPACLERSREEFDGESKGVSTSTPLLDSFRVVWKDKEIMIVSNKYMFFDQNALIKDGGEECMLPYKEKNLKKLSRKPYENL